MTSLFVIERGCPNCNGPVENERIERGLPCKTCLPEEKNIKDLCAELDSVKFLKEPCELNKRIEEFKEFFTRSLGLPPTHIQQLWAKRVFKGKSFLMHAPTGIGKSTFCYIMGLYLKGKVIYIFPTRILAEQAKRNIEQFIKRTGNTKRVLLYKRDQATKKEISEGNFDILLCTNMFFHRNFEILKNFSFSCIFVDDVDSFLKNSRNVKFIFRLMGLPESLIKEALQKPIQPERTRTVLVLSSATARPKPQAHRLFRNILGIDIQPSTFYFRNIVDIAEKCVSFDEALQRSLSLIKVMGKGGVVYVSSVYGKETVHRVAEFYQSQNLQAIKYLEEDSEKLYEHLSEGNFDVVIGLCHPGNPLVRGIDIPEVIRYCLFIDIPQIKLPVEVSLKPSSLYSLLWAIYGILDREEKEKALNYIAYLRKYLSLDEDKVSANPSLLKRTKEVKDYLDGLFSRNDFLEKIKNSDEINIQIDKEGLKLVIADANTYIQASGRTSRLVSGRLIKGLSAVFYTDTKAFVSLKRRLSSQFYNREVEFLSLNDIDLEKVKEEIDRDRQLTKKVLRPEPIELKDFLKTSLVVVESPKKARTIAEFFSRPQTKVFRHLVAYEVSTGDRVLIVTSCLGHVLDLVTDKGFFGVEKKNNHFLAYYDTLKTCLSTGQQHTSFEYLKTRCEGTIEDKFNILESLRELATEVDEIFIATDPDSEGEKIAYDLYLHLKIHNNRIYRAEFHEVTPKAFLNSLNNPREINLNLVKAQLVRRILDRWVGFSLSRLLWKHFQNNTLSAGRVQSPVLGWIIDRYNKHKEKVPEISFTVNGHTIRISMEDEGKAEAIINNIEKAVLQVEEEGQTMIHPLPPYRTDTILLDASDKLRMPAVKTMNLLQELFESGFITYHRTDSIRVSETGQYRVAKPFITERFSEEYFYPRSWSAEGAHECIRPTRPIEPELLKFMVSSGTVSFRRKDPQIIALYELIFNRFMASQMRPAIVKKAKLKINIEGVNVEDTVVTEVLHDGFNKLLPTFTVMSTAEGLSIQRWRLRKIPKAPLYTEGALVNDMKQRGLGRPSTYAQIIKTILDRRYAVVKDSKLIPTKAGIKVYEYLSSNFSEYVSEELTRYLEDRMDAVEEGRIDYRDVLLEIYEIKSLLPD